MSSVVAVELDRDREYAGGMADWIARVLMPALGTEREGYAAPKEQVVLEALAGRGAGGAGPPSVVVPWEGFDYVADLGGATLARLAAARWAQGGTRLDVALGAVAVAAGLAAGPDTLEAVHAAARKLESLDGRLQERAEAGSITVADYLSRARRDLQAIREPRRIERAEDAGRRLLRLADALVGDVLRSLAYAGLVGEPDSGVLNGGDLAGRHDFGVSIPDGAERRRARLAVAGGPERARPPVVRARGVAGSRPRDGQPQAFRRSSPPRRQCGRFSTRTTAACWPPARRSSIRSTSDRSSWTPSRPPSRRGGRGWRACPMRRPAPGRWRRSA